MLNLPSHDCIADYFLLHIDQSSGDTISNLKLQKLCYYAQAWYLAAHKKPLFSGRIEAWAHGPVVPMLYRRFRQFGIGTIDALSLKTHPVDDLHVSQLEFLNDIWDKYGGLSGTELEILTHSEDPWKKAYGNRPQGSRCEEEITHDSMRRYYERKLRA